LCLSTRISLFSKTNSRLEPLLRWSTEKNITHAHESNVKGGALRDVLPCLFSACACPTAHFSRRTCVREIQRERERDRERECVWAPGTVVIVVNLTTVKAVTACPYRPVYAAESRAQAASLARKISLSSKSRNGDSRVAHCNLVDPQSSYKNRG